jgi:hypothetical protein
MSSPEMARCDNKEAIEIEIKPDNAKGYVTGIKLALIVGSVALACFLMLLDTMVISTVSRQRKMLMQMG